MRSLQFVSFGETIVALLFLVGLNVAFFPDYPAFLTIHPHPFFAVVILVSLRYSRMESLICTGMTCGALWFLATNGPSGMDVALRKALGEKVIIMIIVNLVLGELGALFNREVKEAKDELERLRAEHEALKTKYNALAMVKEELSERIVGQTSSIVSLYEAAKSLDAQEIEEVQEALLNLTSKFIGVERASLFWCDDDSKELKLVKTVGWSDDEERQHKGLLIPFGRGPVGLAAQEGKMFSLNELNEHKDLSKAKEQAPIPSILVAPLQVGGRVVGVINVEQIPFLKFTPTAIRLFYLIADLGSSAISKSARFSAMQEAAVVDPATGLHTSQYFSQRFSDEMQRFKRAQVTFAYVQMEMDDFSELESVLKGRTKRLARELAGLIFANKRDLDVVAPGEGNGQFSMLLPVTDVEGAMTFAKKVQRSVLARISVKTKNSVIRPTASFGISVASEHADSIEQLEEYAATALRVAKENGPGSVKVNLQ